MQGTYSKSKKGWRIKGCVHKRYQMLFMTAVKSKGENIQEYLFIEYLQIQIEKTIQKCLFIILTLDQQTLWLLNNYKKKYLKALKNAEFQFFPKVSVELEAPFTLFLLSTSLTSAFVLISWFISSTAKFCPFSRIYTVLEDIEQIIWVWVKSEISKKKPKLFNLQHQGK